MTNENQLRLGGGVMTTEYDVMISFTVKAESEEAVTERLDEIFPFGYSLEMCEEAGD